MGRVVPASPDNLRLATQVLLEGGVVAVPTETVYGLAARADSADAVGRVFAAKGRPASNPLIVHVLDIQQAKGIAALWPDGAEILASAFWPGPLTLVLPVKPGRVAKEVTGGGDTVALRAPGHPVFRELLRLVSVPLAAPSANASMHISATQAWHVERSLGDRVDLILDGGASQFGLESTVVDVTDAPAILRVGAVSRDSIERIVGAAGAPSAVHSSRSPGTMEKHYAPRCPVEILPRTEIARRERTPGTLVLWCGEHPGDGEPDDQHLSADPRAYGARLFDALHLAETAGAQRIWVEAVPQDASWEAVRDRLRRASA